MPTLNWIGKDAVINHHLAVPFHLLQDVPELACGDPGSGNLIVEGDNLVALKALLPYYKGRVKCICIDPPYNTGNEGWAYNDNVNSPAIRKWLGQTVGKEGETLDRHDRWLCMMYPRLALLREFLSEDGSIFVCLDDNEIHALRYLMDDVFGAQNFVTTVIWEKRTTRENRRVFSFNHDYVLCYARVLGAFEKVRGTLPLTEEVKGRYANPDNDPRGDWQSISLNAQAGHGTASQFYRLKTSGGRELDPPPGRCWSVTEPKFRELVADNRIYFGLNGMNAPRVKKFLSETTKGLTPHTLWGAGEVGTTDSASKNLLAVFAGDPGFNTTPKPPELIERILQIATNPGDLVLDSFAGSGTTGHAVLKMNAAAPETEARRFILVEMEPKIAQDITRERVRRVAEGYTNAKGEAVPGLGNASGAATGFRYARLGEALFDETGQIRSGVRFAELARHVYFTETGEPLPKERVSAKTPLLGIHRGKAIFLLYNGILRDKSFSGGNALCRETLRVIEEIKASHAGVEQSVVYGTSQRLSPARLKRGGITFKQIPYQLRIS
jgi:site-specific DNA-methyltransferase (adenine-specific)/adenine-specific DNA-methyltransferase